MPEACKPLARLVLLRRQHSLIMLDSVRQFIAEHQLFNLETDAILVAVSGGLDSVVLLDVLHRLGAQVAVAHCHFGLRGEDADADEQFVRKLTKQYGLPYFAEFFRTKEFAAQEGISTQMAARLLRYRWFEQVRETQGLAYIATAHHQRDQTETMLLNLTHGTGLAGLHGIQVKNGSIIRPLLGLARRPARLLSRARPALARRRQQRQPRVPAQPAAPRGAARAARNQPEPR